MIEHILVSFFYVSSKALVPVRLVRKYYVEQIKTCVVAVLDGIHFNLYKKNDAHILLTLFFEEYKAFT